MAHHLIEFVWPVLFCLACRPDEDLRLIVRSLDTLVNSFALLLPPPAFAFAAAEIQTELDRSALASF